MSTCDQASVEEAWGLCKKTSGDYQLNNNFGSNLVIISPQGQFRCENLRLFENVIPI